MGIIKLTEYRGIKFTHLYASNACIKELTKIIKGSSINKDFQIWLLNRLREIDDLSLFSYLEINPKRFEKIGRFYNITYRHTEKNIRILFSREDNGEVNILLCAMDEKKTSADYKRLQRLAEKRLREEREF